MKEETEPTGSYSNSYIIRQMQLVSNESALALVWDFWVRGNSIMSNTYPELKDRTISDCLRAWQTRYNGFSTNNPDLMFLNFTRNVCINYISRVSSSGPKAHVTAVNSTTNTPNKLLAEVLSEVNKQTLINENADAKFRELVSSQCVKGTAIVYEGYKKSEIIDNELTKFDALTGKYKATKQKRVLFDDVYQEEVAVEDFIITSPYQPDVQKQPAVMWRQFYDLEDLLEEFGSYKDIEKVTVGACFGDTLTQFYGNNSTNLQTRAYQVEVIRFYHKLKNRHIIIAGGIPIYDGPMPFKHRKYPFSKAVFEYPTNKFFWGIGLPEKIRGEQDTLNSTINMMDEKTRYSLKPFILSSDDDLSDQEELDIMQIKKVSNIEKYTIKEMPGINAGESNYFNQIQVLLKELAGVYGGANSFTKNGGKLDIKQIMLQQEEANATIAFSSTYLEDMDVERTKQRLYNIMQFYAIPRVKRYGGSNGEKYSELVYKNITIEPESPEDPQKTIFFQNAPTEEEKNLTFDKMEQAEISAQEQGLNLKTSMVDTSKFDDHNFDVKVQRQSAWMKNQSMEQQMRLEYAQYILNLVQQSLSMGQDIGIDLKKVFKYVNESFDVPIAEFMTEQINQMQPPQPTI